MSCCKNKVFGIFLCILLKYNLLNKNWQYLVLKIKTISYNKTTENGTKVLTHTTECGIINMRGDKNGIYDYKRSRRKMEY